MPACSRLIHHIFPRSRDLLESFVHGARRGGYGFYPLASTSRLRRPASAKRAGSSGNESFCSFMFYYKLLIPCPVQMPMQMDLKPGGDELIRKVSDMTKKYGREHLTVWGAFSHRTTTRCREHNPNMCDNYLMRLNLV